MKPRNQKTYERKKAWRAANPEKHKAAVTKFLSKNPQYTRNKHLLRKYGLTIWDIDMIVELQRGCAICHTDKPGRANRFGGESEWIVDHDHKTGEVRGVVCHACNVALGMAKDSVEVLQSMIDYLKGK